MALAREGVEFTDEVQIKARFQKVMEAANESNGWINHSFARGPKEKADRNVSRGK